MRASPESSQSRADISLPSRLPARFHSTTEKSAAPRKTRGKRAGAQNKRRHKPPLRVAASWTRAFLLKSPFPDVRLEDAAALWHSHLRLCVSEPPVLWHSRPRLWRRQATGNGAGHRTMEREQAGTNRREFLSALSGAPAGAAPVKAVGAPVKAVGGGSLLMGEGSSALAGRSGARGAGEGRRRRIVAHG